MDHKHDATITLSYEEATFFMAALDHALCHQEAVAGDDLGRLLAMVDRMASTFGFATGRLDRLLKGKKVHVEKAAFTTRRMLAQQEAWIKRVREGRMRSSD